ncbi:MAG: hypothetical protein V3W20_11775 [Candidatus Neomarinimicrobiota bacterium]
MAQALIGLAGPTLLELGKKLLFGEKKKEPLITDEQLSRVLEFLEPKVEEEEDKLTSEEQSAFDRILGKGIAIL